MTKRLKLLVFGDLHARSRSAFDADIHQRCIDTVTWISELSDEVVADVVINVGDTFDKASKVDYALHNGIARAIDDTFVDWYHLVGNHDIVSERDLDHAIETLPGRCIAAPELVEIAGFKLGMVPFLRERQPLPWDSADLCFAHVGLDAVRFAGDIPFGPWLVDDFKAPLTLGGHYHHRSTFKGETGRFEHIGAVLPNGFKDAGIPFSGAWEVELTEGKGVTNVVLHANPHAKPYVKVPGGSSLPEEDSFIHLQGADPAAMPERDSRIVKVTLPEAPERKVEGRSSGKVIDAISAYADANKLSADVAMEFYEAPPASATTPWRVDHIAMRDFMSVASGSIKVSNGVGIIEGRNLDDGGSNGASKSVLVEALHWALFGRTVRDVSTLTDVIRYGEESCRVKVTLLQGDRSLQVTRERDLGKGKTTLLLDGQDITPNGARDTDAKIVELLGIDSRTFQTTTLMSADTRMLSDLTDLQRERALLEFLGVGFEDARKRLAAARRKAKSEAHEMDRDRSRFEGARQAREEELERRIEEMTAEIDGIRDNRLEDDLEVEVKAQRALVESLDDEATCAVNLNEIEGRLRQLREKRSEHMAKVAELKGVHSAALSALNKLKKLKAAGLTCPTCDQTMSEERYAKAVQSAKEVVGFAADEYAEAVGSTELNELDNEINQLGGRRTKVVAAERRYHQQHKLLSRLEEKLRQSEEHAARVKTLMEQRSVKRRQLDDVRKQKWEPTPEQAKLAARIYQLDKWHEAFGSGLGRYLVENLAGWINDRMRKYVTALHESDDHADVQPSIELTSSGVGLRIIRSCHDVGYGNLSSGQKAMVDLALQAALHDVQLLAYGGVGLIVFDEAASALDAGRYERLVNLGSLKLKGTVSTLWYITHRKVDWDPDYTIVATLEDGVGSYEVHGG